MKISIPAKIILGILTTWIVISPFLLFGLWFFFIFSFAATAENQAQPSPNAFVAFFFPIFGLILLTGLIHIGLQIFYLVHIILNKAGNDVVRIILGVGLFIFSVIAMPIYYFVYILPENPPQWARISNSGVM